MHFGVRPPALVVISEKHPVTPRWRVPAVIALHENALRGAEAAFLARKPAHIRIMRPSEVLAGTVRAVQLPRLLGSRQQPVPTASGGNPVGPG
jgi:hypothetical protein